MKIIHYSELKESLAPNNIPIVGLFYRGSIEKSDSGSVRDWGAMRTINLNERVAQRLRIIIPLHSGPSGRVHDLQNQHVLTLRKLEKTRAGIP